MRKRLTILLTLASLLPAPLLAVPFSASEREANPAIDILPPTPSPVRPVNPTPVMPATLAEPAPAKAPPPAAATSPAAVTDTAKADAAKLAEEENPQISNTAVLQGLNKVTGHISRLEGRIGSKLRFGNLEIIPRRCWKSAPEDRPEDAILLEIREFHTGEDSKQIFLGWMFSSSPGLAGLEHPVYDINVLACEYHPDVSKAAPASAAAPAEVTKAKKPDATPKKPAAKPKKATPAAATSPAAKTAN